MRKVCFYHSGEVHPYVHKMVESVKEHFDLPLIQMTNSETAEIKGVDEVIREDYGGMALSRIASIRYYDHDELLILDNDLIVRRNIEHVFDKDFDVGLTYRTSHEPGGQSKINQGQPFNSGVMFSKCPEFWVDCLEWCYTVDPKAQEWGCEQRSVNKIALEGNYNVLELPCTEYNWSPNPGKMESDAAVWHYKGDRKRWM